MLLPTMVYVNLKLWKFLNVNNFFELIFQENCKEFQNRNKVLIFVADNYRF